MTADELLCWTDGFLESSRFSDYCVNGLQVSGDRPIKKIVSGVTASYHFIDQALAEGADCLLVHHGLFWFSDPLVLTGPSRKRVARLLSEDVALLAYHLPLDAHPEVGNNACLGRLMDWSWEGETFGRHQLGFVAPCAPIALHELVDRLSHTLNRVPLVLPDNPNKTIRRVAWVTGAGQSYFKEAIACRADVFVTGEVSEFVFHLAVETGVPYIAVGHHASERYGVQALGKRMSEVHGVVHHYLEIDNPV